MTSYIMHDILKPYMFWKIGRRGGGGGGSDGLDPALNILTISKVKQYIFT